MDKVQVKSVVISTDNPLPTFSFKEKIRSFIIDCLCKCIFFLSLSEVVFIILGICSIFHPFFLSALNRIV